MEYAIGLADADVMSEFEDLFKLASLIDRIAQQRPTGMASTATEERFLSAVRKKFAASGPFRQEVERYPAAKRLIQGA